MSTFELANNVFGEIFTSYICVLELLQDLAGRKLFGELLKVFNFELFVCLQILQNEGHCFWFMDHFDLSISPLEIIQNWSYDQNYEPLEVILCKVVTIQQGEPILYLSTDKVPPWKFLKVVAIYYFCRNGGVAFLEISFLWQHWGRSCFWVNYEKFLKIMQGRPVLLPNL